MRSEKVLGLLAYVDIDYTVLTLMEPPGELGSMRVYGSGGVS